MSARDGSGDRPTKLKRKEKVEPTKPISSSLVTNIYEKISEYEEKAALKRDGEEDERVFMSTCQTFKDLIQEVAELKSQNQQKLVSEKKVDGSLLFVTMKRLNRMEKFRLNNCREKLTTTKHQVDSLQLQLENLLYEINHLQKEIYKCLQFASRDEAIDLIPVEEFYKEAPESMSRPGVTKRDEHQLRLARLEWELDRRKALAECCSQLENKKKQVVSTIQEKQVRIDNLAPMIKRILNVTKPVQEYLCLPMSQIQIETELVTLLPYPLYFLSVQIDALREACDPLLKVKIIGSREESECFKADAIETLMEDDTDSEGEESQSRHRKKSHAQVQEEKIKQLFIKHPLSVEVTVSLKDGRSICIVVGYFPNLGIVTVFPTVNLRKPYNGSCCRYLLDGSNILDALFPDDFGDDSPNVANHYQFQQLNTAISKRDHGIPYVWAQRLCGLNFPTRQKDDTTPPLTDAKNISTQKSTISIIKAIRKRLKARLELCFHINEIEKLTLPAEVPISGIHFPVYLKSLLSKLKPLSWEEYEELSYTTPFINSNFVSQHDLLFEISLTRNDSILTAAIALKPEYPSLPPVYALQLKQQNEEKNSLNDNNIRDLEKELNIYYKELTSRLDKPSDLLIAQLYRLIAMLDIYSECLQPETCPREKLYLHQFRGRARTLPLKCVIRMNGGSFVQR